MFNFVYLDIEIRLGVLFLRGQLLFSMASPLFDLVFLFKKKNKRE